MDFVLVAVPDVPVVDPVGGGGEGGGEQAAAEEASTSKTEKPAKARSVMINYNKSTTYL